MQQTPLTYYNEDYADGGEEISNPYLNDDAVYNQLQE